jgi:HK97 family phage prohead protease
MSQSEIRRADAPPRDGLMRMSQFALRDAGDGGGDGNTLDGYAAVFNSVTVIDSWEGRFKEQIAPGSMRKSFREKPPVIQFDHGKHPMIGSIPIARLDSITEEVDPILAPTGGAHVVARLHDNWLIQPVRDAIASGSVDGMSFRFQVVKDEFQTPDGKRVTDEAQLQELLRQSWMDNLPDEDLLLRTLREVRVAELGPVVFPAYSDTSVGVRSQKVTIDLGRLHDPDQRSILARAVLMADQAEEGSVDEDAPQATPEITDPPSGSRASGAGEHAPESDDQPQATPDGAGEHSSISRLDIRHFSADARQTMHSLRDQKGRYQNA